MPQDLRELSRRWFEQAWNQRDDSILPDMIAPDALIHGLAEDGRTLRGPSEFAHFRRPFLSAFDDLHLDIEDVLADGDKSVVRFTFSATHTGEGLGLAPTNRRFRSTAIVILQWCGGKIIEAWNEFDAAGMLRQLTSREMTTCRVDASANAINA
ncbi:MAG TPA: ester cyclase [Tepidisphaeraceae bacterium]|jgi:predicted ester cyclase